MNSGTGLNILQKAMPDRYFDVGIAEQQAILFASGLALQGGKPVAAIYSTFLQRAYDQIVHDVCLQKLNVVFAMDRAGLVGDDGPTHHGAFDIAYLRCLPNIVLMAPRDEAMLVRMLHTALARRRPVALRYPRGEGTGAAARPAARRSRSAPARSSARPRGAGDRRPGRADRLRHRRRQGAGGGRGSSRPRDRGDRRGRALRQADRCGADGPARGRARPAGDGRGGRARGRLRLGGLGDAQRAGSARRGSSASGCPTASSPTASRRCCTRRSATPAERIAERVAAAVTRSASRRRAARQGSHDRPGKRASGRGRSDDALASVSARGAA